MVLIDDSILESANMTEQELKVELAVMLYAQKRFSFGQAKELAGLGYFEFEKLLHDRNIASNYGVDEFQEDLKTIEFMRRGSGQ